MSFLIHISLLFLAFFIWFAYNLKSGFDMQEKLGSSYGNVLAFWLFIDKKDVPKEDLKVIRVHIRKFFRSIAILLGFIIILMIIRINF